MKLLLLVLPFIVSAYVPPYGQPSQQAGEQKRIGLVSPTSYVMKFVTGGSVTLTWRYIYNKDKESLEEFACGYKNKENIMVNLANDFTGNNEFNPFAANVLIYHHIT